jgi:hypothetical protein
MVRSKKVLVDRVLFISGGLWLALGLIACNSMSNALNPLYEAPPPEAYLGEPNDHALNGEKDKVFKAREALEHMNNYQRSLDPQPVNPVMQPAVVRLMWVPDHLNKNGDLVPAHFYYLKVLSDRWGVTDAFELESQLSPTADASTGIPYVKEQN